MRKAGITGRNSLAHVRQELGMEYYKHPLLGLNYGLLVHCLLVQGSTNLISLSMWGLSRDAVPGRTHRIWPFTLLSGVLLDPQLKPTAREALNKLPQQCCFHTSAWTSLPSVALCNSKSPGEERNVGVSFHCNLPQGYLPRNLMSQKLTGQTQRVGHELQVWKKVRDDIGRPCGWGDELKLQVKPKSCFGEKGDLHHTPRKGIY